MSRSWISSGRISRPSLNPSSKDSAAAVRGLEVEEDVERSDLVTALFIADAIDEGGKVDDIQLDDAIGSFRKGVATEAPLVR